MKSLMTLTLTAVLGASLAGCEPDAAPETDDAADISTPAAAEIDATAGAEDFVRALYVQVADPEFSALYGPTQPEVFSASAVEAIQTAADLRGSETPLFEADPLCNCQDPEGVTLQAVTITQTDADRADAAVELMQDGAQTSTTLNLVRQDGDWRVDNVTPEGDPSMRDQLEG